MAEYDAQTKQLLGKAEKLHKCCVMLRCAFSEVTSPKCGKISSCMQLIPVLSLSSTNSLAGTKKELEKLLGKKPVKGEYPPAEAVSDVEFQCSVELRGSAVCKHLLLVHSNYIDL